MNIGFDELGLFLGTKVMEKSYRLDEMKPYGPDMRRLRGAEIGMVFQDPMSSLNPVRCV